MRLVLAYLSTAIVFAALDFVWLNLATERFYRPAIGSLMADKVRMGPAVVFYLVYMAGIVIFAVWPGLKAQNVTTALIYGALFGVIAYATYDLTNMATLKIWPMKIVLLDLAWGAVATSVAAVGGTLITRAVFKA